MTASSPEAAAGADWFVVLPDSAAAAGPAAALATLPGAVVALRHASGRPCLVGCFTTCRPVCARAGTTAAAVVGHSAITSIELARHLGRLRHRDHADALAERIPGSYHLVLTADGAVRAQGTASGLRRLFHTGLGDVTVVGDRAALLARLRPAGAELDAERLALHLPALRPPAELAGTLWRGVHPVPAGEAAYLDGDGPLRLRPWWRPPPAHLPLAQAAPAFAEALRRAVDVRVTAGATVAADLSGGLDSTPLCFLAQAAARARGARLVTFRMGQRDPDHDDEPWARRAAAHLDAEHLVAAPGTLPGWFSGVATPVTGLDEPLLGLHALHRMTAVAALLAGHGARLHLGGHGGDELLTPTHGYLHDLARIRPSALWWHLRHHRVLERWSRRATLAALADRRDYPTWLAAQAALLAASAPPPGGPEMGWQVAPRLPSWVTREAAATAARLLGRAARAARPLAPLRSQHQVITHLRISAAGFGPLHDLTAAHGAALHVPYYDDHVMTAVLATRIDHLVRPGACKPLTVAAMTGRVPAACLARTTKADFGTDLYDGLARHRDELIAMAGDSRLAGLGLADPAALRRACLHTPADSALLELMSLVAVENWLRALPPSLAPPAVPAETAARLAPPAEASTGLAPPPDPHTPRCPPSRPDPARPSSHQDTAGRASSSPSPPEPGGFRLRRGVICTPVEDGAVLLDERTGRYRQLNPTAYLVVRALLDGATPAEAARRLVTAHPGAAPTATADVAALLERLHAAGLTETTAPP
ncbi:lasso peptide biosynthesis PqqD family chaperone [Nonomuraea candida]|uniref:lasso peptide biosynthesis PqqD family chaperone n=1 Tax=Nonomuraea candida TaxID=359159 RepID=UPI00069398F6|nr:lasso peptide biosynthesis PqqD family chaperone [Nonomuraea candida]